MTLGDLQSGIYAVEGFRIRVSHRNGRKVRKDKNGVGSYHFDRAAKNNWTVRSWATNRISDLQRQYTVDVLDGKGQPVWGNTLLTTVRATYE